MPAKSSRPGIEGQIGMPLTPVATISGVASGCARCRRCGAALPSSAVSSIVAAAGQLRPRPEVQLETLDVGFEPVGQLVLGNEDRPGRRKRHQRQVIDVHFVVQGERVVAQAPVVADALVAVDDQRVDAESVEPRRDRRARPGRRPPPARPDRDRRRSAPCGAGRASSRRRNRASSSRRRSRRAAGRRDSRAVPRAW